MHVALHTHVVLGRAAVVRRAQHVWICAVSDACCVCVRCDDGSQIVNITCHNNLEGSESLPAQLVCYEVLSACQIMVNEHNLACTSFKVGRKLEPRTRCMTAKWEGTNGLVFSRYIAGGRWVGRFSSLLLNRILRSSEMK